MRFHLLACCPIYTYNWAYYYISVAHLRVSQDMWDICCIKLSDSIVQFIHAGDFLARHHATGHDNGVAACGVLYTGGQIKTQVNDNGF